AGEERDQGDERHYADEKPRVTNLVLRSEAKLRVSKDAPEGSARSAHSGRPFEAPSGRLRATGVIETDKGNASAAFPTAPHSHSGPGVKLRPCRPSGRRRSRHNTSGRPFIHRRRQTCLEGGLPAGGRAAGTPSGR